MENFITNLKRSLDPSKDVGYYVRKLTEQGYFTPGAIKAVDSAEKIERDCGLLAGEAGIMWKATQPQNNQNLATYGTHNTAARTKAVVFTGSSCWTKLPYRCAQWITCCQRATAVQNSCVDTL